MPSSSEPFTVAAVQAAPVFLNRDATITKAFTLINEAAQHHAQFDLSLNVGYVHAIWLGFGFREKLS